ncbi:hypothetical protein SA2016_1447 [Sinomonas atrocyanea]|uniref:DUF3499 domain-containing protein n=1 Tax=Sinomonas atrocyanea TaxID=37927 RepID=A0A126ZZ27_9MICC|nr:hypothetical protein SA2016_1447 [Sinomonas atrocyanea]GEB66184.1 hypothetical protein SAT01_36320 [Sinomonas atrocyanea]GGG55617.1 hypothetical protein GCM10007172_03230 [Sinomonas atrocyanea]
MATLTYVYADSTAVLGPLATFAEPHSYDLCATHAERLTVPRGWDVLRLALPAAPPRSPDDILALADAVREGEAPSDDGNDSSSGRAGAHRADSEHAGDRGAGDRPSRAPLDVPPGADIPRRHLRLLREPY